MKYMVYIECKSYKMNTKTASSLSKHPNLKLSLHCYDRHHSEVATFSSCIKISLR